MGEDQIHLLQGELAGHQAEQTGLRMTLPRLAAPPFSGQRQPRLRQRVAELVLATTNLCPFLLGERLQATGGRGSSPPCRPSRRCPGRAPSPCVENASASLLVDRLSGGLQRSPDLVVHAPHHLGWSGDVVPLEDGEELVLLALVVVLQDRPAHAGHARPR